MTRAIVRRPQDIEMETEPAREEVPNIIPDIAPTLPVTKSIDDLLLPPGRHMRPIKLVVIMRGPPGSGKTYTAKLIKVSEAVLTRLKLWKGIVLIFTSIRRIRRWRWVAALRVFYH